jgi:hypothetical protein
MKNYVLANLANTGESNLFNLSDFKSFNRKLPTHAHKQTKAERIADMFRVDKHLVQASNDIDLFHSYLDEVYYEGKAEQLAAESPEEYTLLLNDFLHGRY